MDPTLLGHLGPGPCSSGSLPFSKLPLEPTPTPSVSPWPWPFPPSTPMGGTERPYSGMAHGWIRWSPIRSTDKEEEGQRQAVMGSGLPGLSRTWHRFWHSPSPVPLRPPASFWVCVCFRTQAGQLWAISSPFRRGSILPSSAKQASGRRQSLPSLP